jgi:hypothetical protein
VEASLEVGGELLVDDAQGQPVQLPMSVAAKLRYDEHFLTWSVDPSVALRSARQYELAEATLKSDRGGANRSLPEEKQNIVVEVTAEGSSINGLVEPLTRAEADLVQMVGNTLVVDWLLPGRRVARGESWDHEPEVIKALLGMDHVAKCDVSSKVTGEAHHQVQIRLAGTVHGMIDGAATQIELRGAYLFHLQHGRVTKFNLAIREERQRGDAVPGLDATAKLTLLIKPQTKPLQDVFDRSNLELAREATTAQLRQLLVDMPGRGFRFRHAWEWYVTAETPELLSLRLIQEGQLTSHCNVSTSPADELAKPPALADFEKDVRASLGKKLDEVVAGKQWESSAGHRCLGIFANGKVEDVPVQWRYYLIHQQGLPRVTVSVTVEQSRMPGFADADRLIVDSLELLAIPPAQTARAGSRAKK